jgi:hypothetical protein
MILREGSNHPTIIFSFNPLWNRLGWAERIPTDFHTLFLVHDGITILLVGADGRC